MGNGLLSYHFSFRKHGWNIFFALAVLLFLISLTFRITSENAEKAAEAAKSDKAMTLYDHIFSICFVKSNIEEWKIPIALDFIKFVHTDESLAEFTVITNTPKAFNYEIGEEDLVKMTTFGRSVIELKNRSNIVYPYSSDPLYVNNQSVFGFAEQWRYSSTTQFAPMAIRDDGITAEEYFSQLYTYTKTKWSGLNR